MNRVLALAFAAGFMAVVVAGMLSAVPPAVVQVGPPVSTAGTLAPPAP